MVCHDLTNFDRSGQPGQNLQPVKTGQNRQNEQIMLALTVIWHDKPLASWVMYLVATLNIKHSFRFFLQFFDRGNGENKRYDQNVLLFTFESIYPHLRSFSVSEIWTVRGTGAESRKRSKDPKRREIRVRTENTGHDAKFFQCKCSIKID